MNAPFSLCHNGRIAVALAEADFFIFPCINKPSHSSHKKPLVQWPDKSTNDPEQVRAWWLAEYRYALPGLDLSKSGLIAVDGDLHHEGQDGPASIEMILGQKLSDIGCPVVVTPSGGVHCFFIQPRLPDDEGSLALGNGTGSLPYGIDIRGHGGYVIAPGAATGDKRLYRRLPGTPDLSDAFHAGTIPYLPDAIVEAIRSGREDKRVVTEIDAPQPRAYTKSGNREGAWGAAALENELRRIADAPQGARNNVLAAKAFYLGTIAARGWIDPSAAIAGMMGAVKGWTDPKKTISTLNRCFTAGLGFPHDDLPDSRVNYEVDKEIIRLGEAMASSLLNGHADMVIDEETGEITPAPRADTPEPQSEPAKAGPASTPQDNDESLPDHLTRPAGVLGDIIGFIEASAQLPSRALSLGAAIVTLGTVIGRRVAGPTKSGVHLYVISLAPSGSGKDHAPRRVNAILSEVCDEMVGPSEFMSQSAVMRHMQSRPLSLCCIDEFGAFLGRVTNPRSSNHERLISKQLREYWGASFETVRPALWASDLNDAPPIVWPAMSILGSGVHDEFFGALSSKESANGFLNRFLMLSSTAPVEIIDEPAVDKREIPTSIIEALKALFDITRGNFFFMGDSETARQETPANPLYDAYGMIVIPWADDATRDAYRALRRHALERQQKTGTELWARTAEIAVRLATVHSVSRAGLTAETRVEAEDFAWGAELAVWSATAMEREAELRIADTEAQARAKLVLLSIHQLGGKTTHRDLNRKLQHRFRNSDLKDAIDALEASGAIVVLKATPKKGGPPTFVYVIPKKGGRK